MTSTETQLISLFKTKFGVEPSEIERLPLSGSNREYYKISSPNAVCVGTYGNQIKENEAFISFSNSLKEAELPVPEILAVSDDKLYYLQTYIEGVSLFDYLEKHRLSDGSPDNTTIDLYKKTLSVLPKFQTQGVKYIDFDKCFPRKRFDSQSIMWDLNYFKYYFLKTTHTVFDEQLLENDFQTLTEYLCTADSEYFLYRDFQSRNIMVTPEGDVKFIDYQGGRKGALQYDIASLLYDGKAAIPPEVRIELLDFYINELKKYINFDEKVFRDMFAAFAYVRIMQSCGSYGYRGFLEKKPHFLASIAPAMKNLKYLLEYQKLPIEIPHLEKCLVSLTESEFLKQFEKKKCVLTVTVGSFSYRKGLPYDPSGNGGGFIFDCRAIHNPGRYEEYKGFTGKDQPVIDFFANEPEMAEFVSLTQNIVKISIEKYIKRMFANLSVYFGCTGGQHRSVYCAERMAEFIRKNYPEVNVVLIHREQDK